MPPYLYQLVEIAHRELESKFLLAVAAARHGITSIVAEDRFLEPNLARLPPGVVLEKSFTERRHHMFIRPAVAAGHRVVGIDEEGVNAMTRVMAARFNVAAMTDAHRVFAWGAQQAEMIQARIPDQADKVVVTGSQRWDLLRPPFATAFDDQAAAIRKIFGRFVLINTDMPHNRRNADVYFKTIPFQNGTLKPDDQEGIADYFACLRNANESWKRFIPLLQDLVGRFPQTLFVLRPHPTAPTEMWARAFDDHPNVHILSLGSVEPWLRACTLLVVERCTTALQAVTMGVPVVSFQARLEPVREESWVAFKVAHTVHDGPGLVAAVGGALDGSAPVATWLDQGRRRLNDYIAVDPDRFACDHMAAEIAAVIRETPALQAPPALDPASLDQGPSRAANPKFPVPDIDHCRRLVATFSRELGVPADLTALTPKVYRISPAVRES